MIFLKILQIVSRGDPITLDVSRSHLLVPLKALDELPTKELEITKLHNILKYDKEFMLNRKIIQTETK